MAEDVLLLDPGTGKVGKANGRSVSERHGAVCDSGQWTTRGGQIVTLSWISLLQSGGACLSAAGGVWRGRHIRERGQQPVSEAEVDCWAGRRIRRSARLTAPGLGRLQCLVEIGNQIVRRLQPDGQPDRAPAASRCSSVSCRCVVEAGCAR